MHIFVNTNPKYKVTIEKGYFKENKLPEGFIITDTNLYHCYKDLIDSKEHFIITAGEASKSIETYFKILKAVPLGVDTIIAIGGGVVGDISGFVASTYKRGIKLIQIPTSVIAMTDSSIGGKNGVNLEKKKNYVGTIYQPSEVIIDTEFLKTLPENEFKNGIAEVIKYSYLFTNPSLDLITSKKFFHENIEKIIIECAKNKARVVEKDSLDTGYRHILNFGHTIGHSIEISYNLSHGEAISIGMVKELEIANKLGLINKSEIESVKRAISLIGLPTELPKNVDIEKVLTVMKSDKKGMFKFAFNEKHYDYYVDEKIVRECLK